MDHTTPSYGVSSLSFILLPPSRGSPSNHTWFTLKRLPKGLTTKIVTYYCVQDTRWTISFRSRRTRTRLKSLQTCHYPCMVAPPLCFRVYTQKTSHPHQGNSVISFLSVCNVPLDNIIYFAVVGANTCFVYRLATAQHHRYRIDEKEEIYPLQQYIDDCETEVRPRPPTHG